MVAPTPVTVADLFERYYPLKWETAKTAAEYRRLFHNYIAPRLGKKALRSVSDEKIARFHQAGVNTPYQANRALSLLNELFSYAKRKKWVDENPCSDIPRYTERKRKRYALADELIAAGERLNALSVENQREVLFIQLLALTGARPTEIERGVLKGSKIVLEDGKRGQIEIHVPPEAQALLQAAGVTDGTKGVAGTTARAAASVWRKIRPSKDLWMRDMRRTFGTNALSSGHDIGVVGEVLNQASIETTKIYAKVLDGKRAAVVNQTASTLAALLALPGPLPAPAEQPE